MKKLELNQMENLEGGQDTVDCGLALGGLMLSAVSITCIGMVTGGLGFALWGIGTAAGLASMVRSC